MPNRELVTEAQTCERCKSLENELGTAMDQLSGAEREIRAWRMRVAKLEREDEAKRRDDPNRLAILAIIERWKQATNHPRSNANAADRFDLVKARLREGYALEHLELAVIGIGRYPYVVNGERKAQGKRSQRHDRMGIALGSGEAVERFANLGAQ